MNTALWSIAIVLLWFAGFVALPWLALAAVPVFVAGFHVGGDA